MDNTTITSAKTKLRSTINTALANALTPITMGQWRELLEEGTLHTLSANLESLDRWEIYTIAGHLHTSAEDDRPMIVLAYLLFLDHFRTPDCQDRFPCATCIDLKLGRWEAAAEQLAETISLDRTSDYYHSMVDPAIICEI